MDNFPTLWYHVFTHKGEGRNVGLTDVSLLPCPSSAPHHTAPAHSAPAIQVHGNQNTPKT